MASLGTHNQAQTQSSKPTKMTWEQFQQVMSNNGLLQHFGTDGEIASNSNGSVQSTPPVQSNKESNQMKPPPNRPTKESKKQSQYPTFHSNNPQKANRGVSMMLSRSLRKQSSKELLLVDLTREEKQKLLEMSISGTGTVFGTDLQELMARPNKNPHIPDFAAQMFTYLRDNDAFHQEGIFRVSPHGGIVDEIKYAVDNGLSVDFKRFRGCNVHVISGLLKGWLAALPNPIIPFELYDNFLEAYDTKGNDPEAFATEIASLITQIPRYNATLLQLLCSFLIEVRDNSAVNKMTTKNLATVLAPSVLHSERAIDPVKEFTNIPKAIGVIHAFIDSYKTIFPKDLPENILGDEDNTPARSVSMSQVDVITKLKTLAANTNDTAPSPDIRPRAYTTSSPPESPTPVKLKDHKKRGSVFFTSISNFFSTKDSKESKEQKEQETTASPSTPNLSHSQNVTEKSKVNHVPEKLTHRNKSKSMAFFSLG